MKHLFGVALAAAMMLTVLVGFAHAQERGQERGLLPGEVPPQRETDRPEQLPQPPPDQFSACIGMTDRAKRDACIERETGKLNPATRTVPTTPTRSSPGSPQQR